MTIFLRLKLILLLSLAAVSCYAPISTHEIDPEIPIPVAVSESSLKSASIKPDYSERRT